MSRTIAKNVLKQQLKSSFMDNSACKQPPPESIQQGQFYAFTFNPSDDANRNNDCEPDILTVGGITKFMNYWYRFFYSLNNVEVMLFPEISSKGRWHFHGFLVFNKIMNAYLIDLKKLRQCGVYEIDTYNPLDTFKFEPIPGCPGGYYVGGWDWYIRKQQHLMEEILDIHFVKMEEAQTGNRRCICTFPSLKEKYIIKKNILENL